MKGLLLISVFIFIGCAGLNIAYWDIGQDFSSIIPLEYYKKNYNKMFDAAIQSGVKEGFNVAYQDKQNGLISLEKLKGSGTCDADVRKYCSQLFPRRILLAHYKAPLQPENPTRELA